MDNTKELNEMLYDKMSAEYGEFIERLYQMEPKEIIQRAYEKVFKEDILMSISEMDLPKNQVEVLLKTKAPLDECYSAWLKADYSYMPDLRECIEENTKHLSILPKQMDRGR